MECGFCGVPVSAPGRSCPLHEDLVLPWEGLPSRRGPKPRRQPREAALALRPVARRDGIGQVVILAAWCSECVSMVPPTDEGLCSCCGTFVLDEYSLKVSQVRFL